MENLPQIHKPLCHLGLQQPSKEGHGGKERKERPLLPAPVPVPRVLWQLAERSALVCLLAFLRCKIVTATSKHPQ